MRLCTIDKSKVFTRFPDTCQAKSTVSEQSFAFGNRHIIRVFGYRAITLSWKTFSWIGQNFRNLWASPPWHSLVGKRLIFKSTGVYEAGHVVTNRRYTAFHWIWESLPGVWIKLFRTVRTAEVPRPNMVVFCRLWFLCNSSSTRLLFQLKKICVLEMLRVLIFDKISDVLGGLTILFILILTLHSTKQWNI